MVPSPSTRDRLGTLEKTADGWQLQYVRQLAKPPATVWRAFVEPDLVDQWFPFSIVGELVVGGRLEFAWKGEDGDSFDGEVLAADAPSRLVFTWGEDVLDFAFDETATGTELTLTVTLSEQGKAARDGAGWHECLDHLVRIEASDPDAVVIESWSQIHPSYVEAFGPEASTIGPPEGHPDAQSDQS